MRFCLHRAHDENRYALSFSLFDVDFDDDEALTLLFDLRAHSELAADNRPICNRLVDVADL